MKRELDADFAHYVLARQHRLLQAAYLVCGDVRLAEKVLEGALATVAGHWEQVREHPDAVVRQHVYADAVAAAKGARREALPPEPGIGAVPSDGALGILQALDALGPRQRALVVLRHFDGRNEAETAEVLGESVPAVGSRAAAAMTILGEVLPPLRAIPGDVGDRDAVLGDLLDRASQHVVEVDLTSRAWEAASERGRSRRRRLVSAVAGIAALGVVVTVVHGVVQRGDTPGPATPTTRTTAPVNRLPDGTMYAAMPLEGDEDRLPDYDAGLPSQIDPKGRAVKLSTLGKPPESVVAVYLRRAGTHYRAVLVPKDRTQVVVDGLDLLPTRDSEGNEGVPLGPKAISPEGRWVVFAQPGALVRLDLQTGAVDRYAVPAADLVVAGWGQGRTVIVRSADRAWTVDPERREVRDVAAFPTAPLTHGVEVPVTDLVGETLSAGQWSASGATFDQDVTSPVIVRGNGPIYQGLVAVDAESRTGRVLLAPESPDGRTGRFMSCCTVLSWADPSTVLFRSAGYDGSWVLAWNVETGRVYDVTRLDDGGGVDYPQALALAVGTRG